MYIGARTLKGEQFRMVWRRKPQSLTKTGRLTALPVRTALRSIARLKISNVTTIGRENVPQEGAVIVVANHTSMIDPFYLWGALRRAAAALGQHGLWQFWKVGFSFATPINIVIKPLLSVRIGT